MFEDIKAEEMEGQAAAAAQREDDEALVHAMADDGLGGPPAPCEELRAMTPGVNIPEGTKRARTEGENVSSGALVTVASAVHHLEGTTFTMRIVIRKSVNHKGVQTDPL